MLSLIASETIDPRRVMPQAFRTVFYRLIIFFVLSALAVGILVPSNDPILLAAIRDGLPGAGRSPYVAAMNRLQIQVLPHLVNAGQFLWALQVLVILTSHFFQEFSPPYTLPARRSPSTDLASFTVSPLMVSFLLSSNGQTAMAYLGSRSSSRPGSVVSASFR